MWASHTRLLWGRESGKDTDPSVVPTEQLILKLSGSLPGHLAHVGLDGLLKWGLHTHPGVRGGKTGHWEQGGSGGQAAEGQRCCGFPRPAPHLPVPSVVTRVQILHLLGNQYALGVPFKPPRKHNGGGAAVAWDTVQRPQAFLGGDWIPWEKKLRTLEPLTSKADDKTETASQLVLRVSFLWTWEAQQCLRLWSGGGGRPDGSQEGWPRGPTQTPSVLSHKHLDVEKVI